MTLMIMGRRALAIAGIERLKPTTDGIRIAGDVEIGSQLGAEKVSNGTFTGDATGWTLAAGWTYSANAVVKDGDGTGTLSQDVSAVANEIYRVTYTVSSWSVGTVTVAVGGVSGTARGADGTYTEYITATGTGSLTFTPTNTARFTIDDVSVRRLGTTAADRVNAWVGDRIASGVEAAGDAGLFLRSEDGTLLFLGDALKPVVNDGLALGSAAESFSDLFLASGGVINFANGDVTLTHASNKLDFAGATSGYQFDNSLGLNVAPSAWAATIKAIDINARGAVYADATNTYLNNNFYYNGTNNLYKETAAAAFFQLSAGTLAFSNAPSGTAGTAITFTERFSVDANGMVLVGDSANANMTAGVTINQGAADNEILALKSSDVAHGYTGLTETDTFGYMSKHQAASGGLLIAGVNGASAILGLGLRGFVGSNADTTKTTDGEGIVEVYAAQHAAGATANVVANGNVFCIRTRAAGADVTRFIFDLEGSAHADVEWVAFDSHDDIALLNKLDAALTRDPIKTEFGRYLTDYRAELQAAKVVNFYDDGPRAMLNTTRLAMLHTGAIRQLGNIINSLAARLQLAEGKLLTLSQGA